MFRSPSIAIIVSIALLTSSCAGEPADTETINVSKPVAISADSLFERTDSLELVYYADPNEQKQYQSSINADSVLINSIVGDLNGRLVQLDPCQHHKKMYLYRNGEVYKTVYISDSCGYLAFAINGQPQYRRMSTDTRSKVDEAYRSLISPVKK